MNKLRLFACCAFLIHGLSLARFDPERPEAKPTLPLSTIRTIIRGVGDFFGDESLGFQALLPHNQYFIEAIIAELQMNDYCIEIRGMSNAVQRFFGRTNAFVIPSFFGKKSHAFLFVSEDWFETLSEESKESLIKHELMHLRQNHYWRKLLFAGVSGAAFIALKKLILDPNFDLNNKRGDLLVLNSCLDSACLFGWVLTQAKYSRFIEQEADIEAAKTMNSTQGFVDLFVDIKENVYDPYSRFRIKRIFQKISKYLGSYFSTHPDLDERIEYMKNFNYTA